MSMWVMVKLNWNGIFNVWFQIPQDRTIIRRVLRTVSLSLFVCMSTISSCGIFVAIALIVFNIWNNHRRWVFFFFSLSLLCCCCYCSPNHVSIYRYNYGFYGYLMIVITMLTAFYVRMCVFTCFFLFCCC